MLTIPNEIKQQLIEMIDKAGDLEVGGLMIVKDEVVQELIILPYSSQLGGYFEINEDALADFIATDKRSALVNGWFHRHPIQGWSGTDYECFQTLHAIIGKPIHGIVVQANEVILYSLLDKPSDKFPFFQIREEIGPLRDKEKEECTTQEQLLKQET